jgi:low temperature requirement protein LtrA
MREVSSDFPAPRLPAASLKRGVLQAPMSTDAAAGSRARRFSAELREQETVKPLELYFDLVFVLGFTQCTALMAANPSWEAVAQGMLVLAMLWLAWAGYAWLTSVIDPEEGSVRIAFFAAMAGLLVVALCVPEAFDERALAFALAYAVVRAAHIALFLLASRDDAELRHSVLGLGISTAIAVCLLVGASFLDGIGQAGLWVLAVALDGGGPALFGLAGWRLVPGHFAERHNLVIILALGESIVALGIGAQVDLTLGVIAAAVLGVALASAVWWAYFDVVALVTALRLTRATEGRERNALARDSYTYLHYPMVAGIVLVAFALKSTLAHVDDPLDSVHRFALLGGIATYLLAHVALRLRNARSVNLQRLMLALLLLAIFPIELDVPSLATLAAVNVLLWSVIVYETIKVYDERRYRLRHGLPVEPPSR